MILQSASDRPLYSYYLCRATSKTQSSHKAFSYFLWVYLVGGCAAVVGGGGSCPGAGRRPCPEGADIGCLIGGGGSSPPCPVVGGGAGVGRIPCPEAGGGGGKRPCPVVGGVGRRPCPEVGGVGSSPGCETVSLPEACPELGGCPEDGINGCPDDGGRESCCEIGGGGIPMFEL